jgi:hypothetical protein
VKEVTQKVKGGQMKKSSQSGKAVAITLQPSKDEATSYNDQLPGISWEGSLATSAIVGEEMEDESMYESEQELEEEDSKITHLTCQQPKKLPIEVHKSGQFQMYLV